MNFAEQKAALEAREAAMYEELAKAKKPEEPHAEEQPAAQDDAPPVETEEAAAPVETPAEPEPTPEPEQKAPETESDRIAQLEAQLQQVTQERDLERQRASSAQGRLKEEGVLDRQVRAQQAEINELKAALAAQPKPAPKPASSTPDDDPAKWDDARLAQELNWSQEKLVLNGRDYAEDLALALRAKTAAVPELDQRLRAIEDQARRVAADQALQNQVPNYLELKHHEDLPKFLQRINPNTGRSYGQHLEEFEREGNYQGEATIFNVFDSLLVPVENTEAVPTPEATPAVKPGQKAKAAEQMPSTEAGQVIRPTNGKVTQAQITEMRNKAMLAGKHGERIEKLAQADKLAKAHGLI